MSLPCPTPALERVGKVQFPIEDTRLPRNVNGEARGPPVRVSPEHSWKQKPPGPHMVTAVVAVGWDPCRPLRP